VEEIDLCLCSSLSATENAWSRLCRSSSSSLFPIVLREPLAHPSVPPLQAVRRKLGVARLDLELVMSEPCFRLTCLSSGQDGRESHKWVIDIERMVGVGGRRREVEFMLLWMLDEKWRG